MNYSNLNDRNNGSSTTGGQVQEESHRGCLFTKLFIVGVLLAGLLATTVPFWSIYQSIDPMEQRELFFQSDIIYVNTRNVLFWVIVSFISPAALGLVYLIFRGGLARNKLCKQHNLSGGAWKKNVLPRIFLSILTGGIVVWLVSHLDFRWADQQAGGWIRVHDLGKLLLGSLIGPMALVAILFLVTLLCVIWIGKSDEPAQLEGRLIEEISSIEERPGEKTGMAENMGEKTS
jgi:hypothetical protein